MYNHFLLQPLSFNSFKLSFHCHKPGKKEFLLLENGLQSKIVSAQFCLQLIFALVEESVVTDGCPHFFLHAFDELHEV